MSRLRLLLAAGALFASTLLVAAAGWLPLAKSSGGGGSVTLLDVGTDFILGADPSTGTPLASLNATANALLCGAVFSQSAASSFITSPTMNWDSTGTNQSMTLIGTLNNASDGVRSVQTALFGLLNPTTGASKTLSVGWATTSTDGYANCISFSGVNSTFATAFQNETNTSGISTAPSVTVTSASTNVAVAIMAARGGCTCSFASVNNTQWFLDNTGNDGNGAGNYAAPGSGSTVLSGTLNNSGQWVASGVSVSP